MQVAPTVAIIAVMPIAPTVPVVREAEPLPRPRPKDWVAPSALGRGRLIDLVV